MTTVQSLNNGMFECYVCRDGEQNIDCSECGRQKDVPISEPLTDLMETSDYSKLLIPTFYRGVKFNSEQLIEQHAGDKHDTTFMKYANQLGKVHSIFEAGKLPPKSAIFVAPKTYGKVTFVYSCMQLAHLHGHKVFPMMDTEEIQRFITLSEQRPLQPIKGFGKDFNYSYEDFLEADVVFITITKSVYRKNASQVIEQILDKRSRYDKPTFFISGFSMAEIGQFDYSQRTTRMIDRTQRENPLRYPVIIQFLDSTNMPSRY